VLDAAHGAVYAAAQRRHRVGGQPTQHVVRVLMHVAVLVGVLRDLAQRVVQVRLLLAGAGSAGAGVGVLDGGHQVVAGHAAAARGGHAVDVSRFLVGAARLVGAHGQDVVGPVIRVFGGHVAAGRLGAAGVV